MDGGWWTVEEVYGRLEVWRIWSMLLEGCSALYLVASRMKIVILEGVEGASYQPYWCCPLL